MNGFIVYATYRLSNNKATIHLYGRLENGESFLSTHCYKPYFFILEKDAARARKLKLPIPILEEKTSLKTFSEEPVVKILLDNPQDVPAVKKALEEDNVRTYEADIRFTQRFLMDNGIKSSLFIAGEYSKGKTTDRIYVEPEIKPADFFPNLKVLSLDIETDTKGKEIYCIGLYTHNYAKVIIRSTKELHHAITVSSEKELLQVFYEECRSIDPDIITGWNVIDFDLKIIEQRSAFHKLPFRIGRTDDTSKLKLQTDFMKESSAEVPGRLILDGIHLLKLSFIRLDDYRLDTAAEHFLGEKKLIGQTNKGKEIEDAFRNHPQKLIDYNLKDCELVYKIIVMSNALSLTINRSLLTGMQLDRVRGSIASLDSLYLRRARIEGYVCPNSAFSDEYERIKGGFVKDSIPGLYKNIIVVDFKSLYPSIMRTFNIDPLSFVTKEKRQHLNEKELQQVITSPNGAQFLNTDGLLPRILQDLWEQREKARKSKNEQLRYAIKIIMNSFFGVLANPTCRFYNLDMANAITHFGQYLIKLTCQKIEEKGYTVIYSDTDSAFVDTHATTYDDAVRIGKSIGEDINKFYDAFVKNEYHRKSYLELEYEKTFIKFLMPTIRGSEVGAKKRYAGLLLENGKEKMTFTGLESVRSDWTVLAKKFQNELLDKIFHEQEVGQFIKTYVADLKAGKFDDELVYRKKLTKQLSSYEKTTPPHVKAARLLPKLESNIIKYFMTLDGPQPIQLITSKIDYQHYIDKQLKPIADSILSFYGKTIEDFLNTSKQTNLFGY
ncbi:MAG: DNA polymerase II [archaeon]